MELLRAEKATKVGVGNVSTETSSTFRSFRKIRRRRRICTFKPNAEILGKLMSAVESKKLFMHQIFHQICSKCIIVEIQLRTELEKHGLPLTVDGVTGPYNSFFKGVYLGDGAQN